MCFPTESAPWAQGPGLWPMWAMVVWAMAYVGLGTYGHRQNPYGPWPEFANK